MATCTLNSVRYCSSGHGGPRSKHICRHTWRGIADSSLLSPALNQTKKKITAMWWMCAEGNFFSCSPCCVACTVIRLCREAMRVLQSVDEQMLKSSTRNDLTASSLTLAIVQCLSPSPTSTKATTSICPPVPRQATRPGRARVAKLLLHHHGTELILEVKGPCMDNKEKFSYLDFDDQMQKAPRLLLIT